MKESNSSGRAIQHIPHQLPYRPTQLCIKQEAHSRESSALVWRAAPFN